MTNNLILIEYLVERTPALISLGLLRINAQSNASIMYQSLTSRIPHLLLKKSKAKVGS